VALARQAGRGDHGAFEELVRRHAAALFAVARPLVQQPADVEDVVQETLVAALQSLARFEGRSSLRTWLVSILIRKAGRHRQHASKATLSLNPAAPGSAPGTAPGSANPPEVARRDTDARMDIANALDRLSPEHRQVMVLREVAGLGYQEIADLLHLPRGTVESRLFRARQAMREHLRDYAP
jgi:RNA polymerase sigma-70 factor, ECF subfamily